MAGLLEANAEYLSPEYFNATCESPEEANLLYHRHVAEVDANKTPKPLDD